MDTSKKIKLSVITVCLNEKNSVRQTIESVLNQDFSDFEYIIIDGASTDGSLEIINGYKNKISKIISESDKGIFYAMNKAISLAQGEFIIFLNAGDYFVDRNVISEIFKDSEADIIYGDVIFKYSGGLLMRRKSPEILTSKYFFIDSLNHQTTFIRKLLFQKGGLFDTSLKITADYDFILKSIFKYKCSVLYKHIPVSVFNLQGISSRKDLFKLQNQERRICLERYFSVTELKNFDKFRLFYDLFYKKFRYLYFLLLSIFSKRFLYGK